MSWFSGFITANVIGIGSNLDNAGVGIAYGIENIRFPHWVNLMVNLIGFSTALFGAYVGTVIHRYISPREASWAACLVLCTVGLFILYTAYVHPRVMRSDKCIRLQKPGIRQGLVLGFALSLTNLATGCGATVSNAAPLWITVFSISIWGYLMIWLGNICGIEVVVKFLGRYSSMVSGLVLIAVGIHQIF